MLYQTRDYQRPQHTLGAKLGFSLRGKGTGEYTAATEHKISCQRNTENYIITYTLSWVSFYEE